MQLINNIHERAMNLVDDAHLAKMRNDLELYRTLTKEALELESQAAHLLDNNLDLEPTRSILFRSAASLALELNMPRVAERLISAALAGNPPDEIADELRDLLEDVYFSRHLNLRGVTLAPGELQMVIDGDAVGFGIAKSESFVQRLRDFEKLLYRTAERKQGKEFRESGRVTKDLAGNFELYISVPRAASFAVTLRLGQSDQLSLPGFDSSTETVDELLHSLEAFSSGNYQALEALIPDETYRTNFIGLAKRISPDGDQVKTVGFTMIGKEGERRVALTKTKKHLRRENDAEKKVTDEVEQNIEKTVVGILLEADATKKKEGIIEIVDDDNNSHKIIVPRGMMSDIVKPMFEERVEAVVSVKDNKLHLITIDISNDQTEPAAEL